MKSMVAASPVPLTLVVTDVVLALPKRERLFLRWAVDQDALDDPPFSAPKHDFFRCPRWRSVFLGPILTADVDDMPAREEYGRLVDLPYDLSRIETFACLRNGSEILAWCDYLDLVMVFGFVRWHREDWPRSLWRSRVWTSS